jgi:hypothetical protein
VTLGGKAREESSFLKKRSKRLLCLRHADRYLPAEAKGISALVRNGGIIQRKIRDTGALSA